MRAKVEEKGVLLPREWLGDAREVEISREEERIVVTPLRGSGDPIKMLGPSPIACGLRDGSTRHDLHIYGRGE